jgi:hypothetical protein
MERLFVADTSFGPFVKGHLVLLDDTDPVQRGWIDTGYLREIKEPDSGNEGADRA